MTEELLNTLLLIGSIGYVISYIPQVWKLIHLRSRAEELSLITATFWVYATGATALYAVLQTDDLGLILSSVANHIGCLAILSLTTFHRHIKAPLLGADNMSVADLVRRRRQATPKVSLVRGQTYGAGPLPRMSAAKARPRE